MSQNKAILDYLKAGNTLTGYDALYLFRTMKLASRISELRDEGHNIQDETIHDKNTGKRYKRYWFSNEPKDTPGEEAIRHANAGEEERINRKAYERKNQYAFL